MKILDNITDTVVRRVPLRRPLMAFTEAVEETPQLHLDHHIRLRMDLVLRMEMTGPVEATGVMRRRAAHMFLHELYGEVADELTHVLCLLYDEDQYRAPDDPVLVKLSAMLDKLRGAGV